MTTLLLVGCLLLVTAYHVRETRRAHATLRGLLVVTERHANEVSRRVTFLYSDHKDERREDLVWRREHHAKMTELLGELCMALERGRPTVPSPIPAPDRTIEEEETLEEPPQARTTVMMKPAPELLRRSIQPNEEDVS